MNIAMAFMYSQGFWIKALDAQRLAEWLMVFIQSYFRAAEITFAAGACRFPLQPKLHYMHHAAHDLLWGVRRGKEYLINPLASSNQMQEDFVGKPSRLSRRVHVRLVSTRVIQRSLICSLQAIEASDLDHRGLM